MSDQWFVRRGGKSSGPLTAARLVALADGGKLKPADEVRAGESDDWVPASTLGWLFPAARTRATNGQPASRHGRPVRRPGDSVEGGDSPPPMNRQQALLLGGGILVSVVLMGWCLCAGVVSLVGNRRDTLTANYYPHKPGARGSYTLSVFVDGGDGYLIHYDYDFGSDGGVERHAHRVERLVGGNPVELDEGTAGAMRRNYSKPLRVRTQGARREVRDGDGATWEPHLKVGAKPGESWEADPNPATKWRYTFVRFGDHQGFKTALVRQEVVKGGRVVSLCDRTYALGVGLLDEEWYLETGGRRVVAMRLRLALYDQLGEVRDSRMDRLTPSEKKFFE